MGKGVDNGCGANATAVAGATRHRSFSGVKSNREQVGQAPPGQINREDARKVLTQRLAELAEDHNFDYGKVSIRSQKTRWGSCSSQNNISLNQNLLHLPDYLIDYVLLHELTHTRVKNHSSKFWNELEKVCPDAKELRKRLKTYGYCLF